jgi:acid stress-induced BolA-like protein IbaG/YrbA
MLEPATLDRLIRAGLPCTHLVVTGDGRHFTAEVVSPEFAGRSRVQRQQRVYQTLRQELDDGRLHALSLRTYTPEEWELAHG